MDEVFVYLVENYYMKGDATWLSAEELNKYIDRAMKIAPNVIGNLAPEMKLPDLATGKEVSLHSVKAKYTVVVFYAPTCGHCKEEMPKIDSMYRAVLKGKGVKIFTVSTEGDEVAAKDFVKRYKLEDWITTWDPEHVGDWRSNQFGYHIVKVLDRRADKGELKVAQILVQIRKSEGEEGVKRAKKRADSVMARLKSGAKFSDMVAEYSDDKFTINDSGVMKPFTAGRMVPAFEDAAFGIKKVGDLAGPIQTDYGFHIIKLLDKTPLKPYDTMYAQLKRKVENDARAQTAKDIYFEKIKSSNGFREYPENYTELFNKIQAIPDTGADAKMIKPADYDFMSKPLFVLAGKNYAQRDFVSFLYSLTRGRINGPKTTVVRDAYSLWVTNVVTDFQEHKLVEEHPDFKLLMTEYRDGIMLFELMDRNVWSKASKDTVGLKAFYESHKAKYMWDAGFEGAVYKFKSKAAYDTGMIMIRQKKYTEEEIAKAINTTERPDAA
eukprot:gene6050-biopygen5271